MDNNLQAKIKTLSDEVKELAALILAEKASAENIQRAAELESESYDEDDFTNLINGYQYVMDELREAYKSLSGALMQYSFCKEDRDTIENKYARCVDTLTDSNLWRSSVMPTANKL